MFDDKAKTEIVENIVHEVNRAYDEGYSDGSKIVSKIKKEKSYEEGLQDAWNTAIRLLCSTPVFLKRLEFDDSLTAPQIICDYSVTDVLNRIEKDAKNSMFLRVGDEVVCQIGNKTIKMFLLNIDVSPTDCYMYSGICKDGNVIEKIIPDDIYKSGVHNYKLSELLEDICCES